MAVPEPGVALTGSGEPSDAGDPATHVPFRWRRWHWVLLAVIVLLVSAVGVL
jgi:hypothetical protein